MTLRHQILSIVATNPGATMDEIVDQIDADRQKVVWSVRDCANKNGLLSRERDDITGQPGYHLTDAGRARLADKAKRNPTPNTQQAQPAVAHSNTGSDRSAAPSGNASSAEAVAVPQKPAPAPPASSPEAEPVAVDVKKMLEERLEGVAHALRGSGLPGLVNVTAYEDLQPHVAALTGAYQMALADLQYRTDSLSAACAALGKIGDELGVDPDEGGLEPILAALRESSEIRLALRCLNTDLQEEARNAQALAEKLQHLLNSKTHELDALRAHQAEQPDYIIAGYLVNAAKRKPRRIQSVIKAREAAQAAIRNGAQRAEVFALVPVGRAVKGAEWRPA